MEPNKPRVRSLTLDYQRSEVNVEERTVPLSVSSDSRDILTYVLGKGTGYEVLDHSSLGSIDLARFAGPNGGPLLYNHDRSVIVGRFTPTEVSGGKLRGIARFGNSAKASEVFRDVQDGILTDTSIYFDYDPDDVIVDMTTGNNDDFPTYRVRKWTLVEASMVPVPADTRTGVGRSAAPVEAPAVVEAPTPEPVTPPLDSSDASRSLTTPVVESTTPAARTAPTQKESTMDPVIVAAEAASELVQAMQLRSIADHHGKGREAEEILTSGKPLAEARGLIMGLLATAPLATTAPSLESMGASKREQEDFRYGRLLEGAINLREGRSASGFELDVSQTIARGMPATYKARGGVFAPFAIRAAAMDSKTAGAGKEFVYTQQGEFIDILRAKLFLTKLGARFMTGLTGPIGFSKQTGAVIANWVDENGGVDAADSTAATGIVTLSPKSLIGIGKISRQLLTVGSWDAELMIRQDLAYSHASALELAGIHGTGGTQPTGIYNLANVNVIAMGGNPTYAKAVDMLTEIAVDNALGGSIGWVTSPRVVGKLLQTLEFAASGAKSAWTGTYEDGYLAGYKGTSSGLIKSNLGASTNEHGMVAGDFGSMICGLFGNGFELLPDHLTLAAQGLVKVNSFGMADIVCRYAESFCKATGVILS